MSRWSADYYMMTDKKPPSNLGRKARWLRKETLKLHGLAPETRIASSLSAIELLAVLYYAPILRFDPTNPYWKRRDRLIISKGHGAFAMYPLLADLGFLSSAELSAMGKEGSRLGSIPDSRVAGIETVNGSLGHGLGVACGIALALRAQSSEASVFVLSGDGEFYEGAMWEAVLFAAHHRLNITLIVDHNKISMLDYCANIVELEPLSRRLGAFGWTTVTTDGHDTDAICESFSALNRTGGYGPRALIAHTIKGKGVPRLESDPLCHTKSLSREEIEALVSEMELGE